VRHKSGIGICCQGLFHASRITHQPQNHLLREQHLRVCSKMDWQQLVSPVIVAAAASLLLAKGLRRRKFSFARDTHCGCTGARTGQQGSIVFRARKGCRPEVVVKMR